MVTSSAAGFVDVFFTDHDGIRTAGQAVGVGGEVAAVLANGVHLGDVFSHRQQVRQGAERAPLEVHIQAGYNDA